MLAKQDFWQQIKFLKLKKMFPLGYKKKIFFCILTEERSRIRSWIWIHYSEVRIRGSGSAPKSHGSLTLVSEYNLTYFLISKLIRICSSFYILISPSVAVNGPSRGLASILHHNGREPLLRLLREVAVRQAQGEEQDQVRQAVHHLLAKGVPFNFSVWNFQYRKYICIFKATVKWGYIVTFFMFNEFFDQTQKLVTYYIAFYAKLIKFLGYGK